ncbi:MAG: Smr/MutS family protein [Mariprofundales bacterium]
MSDDDAALFAAFAGDTRPIHHAKRIQRSSAKPKPHPVARTAVESVLLPMDQTTDEILSQPSQWTLVRAGISRERLRRLGRSDADHLLDLHGKSREQALQQLQQMITIALQSGGRVIEIVHGRGLHSSGGVPVLRQAVYDWLAHGPCHALVLAAIPKPGSSGGACLLLLRREDRIR